MREVVFPFIQRYPAVMMHECKLIVEWLQPDSADPNRLNDRRVAPPVHRGSEKANELN